MTAFYCTRRSSSFQRSNWARLRVVDATTIAFESSFDRALVDAFKSQIPHSARRWDAEHKRWLIDPLYAQHCADLADQYLGVRPTVPTITAPTVPLEQRLVRLDYIGSCKERSI